MLDKNPATRISASEALGHGYFSRTMEVEEPVSPFEMGEIPRIASKEGAEQKPRLLNKVSICSGESYSKALSTLCVIQNPRTS